LPIRPTAFPLAYCKGRFAPESRRFSCTVRFIPQPRCMGHCYLLAASLEVNVLSPQRIAAILFAPSNSFCHISVHRQKIFRDPSHVMAMEQPSKSQTVGAAAESALPNTLPTYNLQNNARPSCFCDGCCLTQGRCNANKDQRCHLCYEPLGRTPRNQRTHMSSHKPIEGQSIDLRCEYCKKIRFWRHGK
jgi:hypothetical protein